VALTTLSIHTGAATISGTATYPDRSALPPDATLEVTVEDVSLADAIEKPDRTLVNTYWKLVQLRGAPVTVAPQQREPHVILQLGRNRIVGSGGCNRLGGTYTLNGDFVAFADVAATGRACAAGMEQEAAFGAALAQVKSWRVRGDELALLDGANAAILGFVAVDLR
jgi:heat shock protein HslJ